MKVLHVISGGETGGSRKHVITLLKQFAKNEVVLAVLQEGALSKEARENGIHVEVFQQTSRYDLSVLKKLARYIRQERFDLLHTHGPRANLFGLYLKKKTKICWVTTIHSDPSLDFMKAGVKGKIFTALHLYAVKKMDHYFAVSERFKKNLMAAGIRGDNITTIYNGIHFTEEKAVPVPRAELGADKDDVLFVMVARLHPIKGHEIVLEALQKLENSQVKVLFVGDGPIRSELEQAVDRRGLSGQVHFLGFRKDVEEIYAASDVALLASYSESFPLALLEAANQHLPVITTDVGGVNELITNEKTGWIVPTGDADLYRQAMEEAIFRKQRGELAKMGDDLYQHASRHFSLTNLYEMIRNTYERLLS